MRLTPSGALPTAAEGRLSCATGIGSDPWYNGCSRRLCLDLADHHLCTPDLREVNLRGSVACGGHVGKVEGRSVQNNRWAFNTRLRLASRIHSHKTKRKHHSNTTEREHVAHARTQTRTDVPSTYAWKSRFADIKYQV